MQPLWLVQTARIRQPLAEADSTLTNSVRFDYMGPAEFEFGALPLSLKTIRANKANMQIRQVGSIREDGHKGKPLMVLSYFDDQAFSDYQGLLSNLRNNSVRLKEISYFSLKDPHFNSSLPDFWWDIQNDAMWSFNAEYMGRLPQYLGRSFSVMS